MVGKFISNTLWFVRPQRAGEHFFLFLVLAWTQAYENGPNVVILATTVGPPPTYAFVFFSSDHNEPPHVHVKRDGAIAKYWLEPVSLAKNRGFTQAALRKIAKLVAQYQQPIVEAWHDYFGA